MSKSEFKTANFQFIVASYLKYLTCKICHIIMIKPTRLHSCGHTFCGNCVKSELIEMCPTCNAEVKLKQPDLLASRLLSDLRVRCLSEGCPWRGKYSQFQQFHGRSCSFKDGGISQWLRKMSETVAQSNKELQNCFFSSAPALKSIRVLQSRKSYIEKAQNSCPEVQVSSQNRLKAVFRGKELMLKEFISRKLKKKAEEKKKKEEKS